MTSAPFAASALSSAATVKPLPRFRVRAHVEHQRVAIEFVERDFVDGARRLALAGRAVVQGRVHVRADVRVDGDALLAPAFAVRQMMALAAEDEAHDLRPLARGRRILDLRHEDGRRRLHRRRQAVDVTRVEGAGEVDEGHTERPFSHWRFSYVAVPLF